MVSYYQFLSDRGQRGLSEHEVKAILKSVLIELVPLHRQGRAHQKISLPTLQIQGKQTVLLLKNNPNLRGSPSQDIYDLGLVTLELLTGKIPSPRRIKPTWDWNNHCLISDQFNAILKRMVTPNPSQRWQNASQVLSAMEKVEKVVPATRHTLKGWQWGLVGAGTTLVLVVGGLGIGNLLIPTLKPLAPSAIWNGQMQRQDAAMFRGNPERTGVYPPGGPRELTELVWRFRVEYGVGSSPAVSGGVVYFGSRDNHLYAVDAKTGQERWRFRIENWIDSSPAVSGGIVYFGSHDGHLYAVDANTGEQHWRFRTESSFNASPTVSGGVVYFSGDDGNLYAVDAKTGEESWRLDTEDRISSSPAVSGGVVYVGSDNFLSKDNNSLYAVDAKTGRERWRFRIEGRINSSPAVSGGVVYFGTYRHLYAVDAKTGQERWRFTPEKGIDSSPAVSGGVVYFGTFRHLYAVNAKTGQERWRFTTERINHASSPIGSSPAVSGEVVYFGSRDHHLYAVDVNTGQERWKFKTEDSISSSPAVSGGVVYFGSWDGHLYAVK